MAWIVALAAAISGFMLVFCRAAGKVSPSPLVPGSPASVVEFGHARMFDLELSGTFVEFLIGIEADGMAVMKTATCSAQGIVFVAFVAIPFPWQR